MNRTTRAKELPKSKVLKMRGSLHDKAIREYEIDGHRMQIKGPFRGVSGILAGHPVQSFVAEREHLGQMFGPDATS
jgi:circadian clock protein KaiC